MSVFFVEGTTSKSRAGFVYVNTNDPRLTGIQIVADRKDASFEEIETRIRSVVPEHLCLYGYGHSAKNFFRVFVPNGSRRGYASLVAMTARPAYDRAPSVEMAVYIMAENLRNETQAYTTNSFCPKAWHGKFEGEEEKILQELDKSSERILTFKRFVQNPSPLRRYGYSWVEKSMFNGKVKDGGDGANWELPMSRHIGGTDVCLSLDASKYNEAEATKKILEDVPVLIQREERVLSGLRNAVSEYKSALKEVPNHEILVVRHELEFRGVLKEKMINEWHHRSEGKESGFVYSSWKGDVVYC